MTDLMKADLMVALMAVKLERLMAASKAELTALKSVVSWVALKVEMRVI